MEAIKTPRRVRYNSKYLEILLRKRSIDYFGEEVPKTWIKLKRMDFLHHRLLIEFYLDKHVIEVLLGGYFFDSEGDLLVDHIIAGICNAMSHCS